MTIDEIIQQWQVDAVIDKLKIGDEAIKYPKLHHKYITMYVNEKIKLLKFMADLKKLKLEKFEFYTQGGNEETDKKGWKLPSVGRILRNDVQMYLEGDPDLINLTLKVGLQNEKVDYLKNVINSLDKRGFAIKNFLEDVRFKAGS